MNVNMNESFFNFFRSLFENRLEKSDVYGIFLYGSSFLGGSSCEAADDRENTVSGPSFLK